MAGRYDHQIGAARARRLLFDKNRVAVLRGGRGKERMLGMPGRAQKIKRLDAVDRTLAREADDAACVVPANQGKDDRGRATDRRQQAKPSVDDLPQVHGVRPRISEQPLRRQHREGRQLPSGQVEEPPEAAFQLGGRQRGRLGVAGQDGVEFGLVGVRGAVLRYCHCLSL